MAEKSHHGVTLAITPLVENFADFMEHAERGGGAADPDHGSGTCT